MSETTLWTSVASYLSTVGWAQIGSSFIGAGVGSALVQGGFTAWREHRERGRSATYIAMRLSVILESFAAECADLIQDNRNAQCPPDEQYPAWDTQIPEIGAYPADENGWRHLDQSLASRCLNLLNKIAGSRSLIRDTIEYVEDEIDDRVEIEAANRGMEAWQLASELRSKHKLPAADLVWDFLPILRVGQRSMETREEERKEQRRRRAIEKTASSA